jgi:glyoxylase-like metal-dependent hydrolase (beta-lactamase superfamily II)
MSRSLCFRIPGIALAILGIWLAWSQTPRPPLTIEKATPNLYVIVGNGGNVAVLPTSDGVILVDDKFAQDAPEILAKVKSVSDKPIRYVLNTHQHGDHTGGNEALLAAKAEIIIQKQARANMVTGNQPGLPHITYNDETQVFLGGMEVDARHLGRGHTNGDAVVFFPSERAIHTGDLFVNGSAPFIDTNNGGTIKEWDQTIDRILKYDFDVVIPGHGPISKKADLVKWAQTLATLRTRIKTACTGDAETAAKRVDMKDLGFSPNANFEKGVPAMCQDLAR